MAERTCAFIGFMVLESGLSGRLQICIEPDNVGSTAALLYPGTETADFQAGFRTSETYVKLFVSDTDIRSSGNIESDC